MEIHSATQISSSVRSVVGLKGMNVSMGQLDAAKDFHALTVVILLYRRGVEGTVRGGIVRKRSAVMVLSAGRIRSALKFAPREDVGQEWCHAALVLNAQGEGGANLTHLRRNMI